MSLSRATLFLIDHSLPYCVAAAIVDRKITTQTFSEEKMRDEKIWQVIDKIKGEASLEFEKMFPAKQPSRVTIRTTGGKVFSNYIEYPKGDPREPMTMNDPAGPPWRPGTSRPI